MKNAEFQDGFETATARFLLLLGIVQRKKNGIRTTRPLDNWLQTTRPRYDSTYVTLEKYNRVRACFLRGKVCIHGTSSL